MNVPRDQSQCRNPPRIGTASHTRLPSPPHGTAAAPLVCHRDSMEQSGNKPCPPLTLRDALALQRETSVYALLWGEEYAAVKLAHTPRAAARLQAEYDTLRIVRDRGLLLQATHPGAGAAQALQRLPRPIALRVNELILVYDHGQGKFVERTALAVLIETLCRGCPVHRLFIEHKSLSTEFVWDILTQLLLIVRFLHAVGVSHGDLKLPNILVDVHGALSLVDFDAAAVDESWQIAASGCDPWLRASDCHVRRAVQGTLHLRAPELTDCDAGVCLGSAESDLWSVGVVALELLLARPPWDFAECGTSRRAEEAMAAAPAASMDLCAVLRRLLRDNPNDRVDAAKLLLSDDFAVRSASITALWQQERGSVTLPSVDRYSEEIEMQSLGMPQ